MFKVRNEADKGVVYLYGTIGQDYWDPESSNSAKAFAQTLDEMSPKPVEIRIDSSGGDVYEGFAIASAIQRYEGPTTAHVDGLAASAASYVAMMADRVVMSDFAQIMIHDAWSYVRGNANDMLDMAAQLESLDRAIAGIISARSGMDVAEVSDLMDAETWFTAPEAVEMGLADEVVETGRRIAACIEPEIARMCKHVPDSVAVLESHARGMFREGKCRVIGNHVIREGN